MSTVVPITGRSPISAHIGFLPLVPTMATAKETQPSLTMDRRAWALPTTICMHDGRPLPFSTDTSESETFYFGQDEDGHQFLQ